MKHLICVCVFFTLSPTVFSQLYGHLPSSLIQWRKHHNGHVKSMSLCMYTVNTVSGKQAKKFDLRAFNMYNKQGYLTEMYNNYIPSDTTDNSTRILDLLHN